MADQKRLATQMAVLQLHIARLQFGNAMNHQRADEIAGVDQRIARHVDNQVRAQKQAGLEQVSQQAGAILSSLRRYQALSNMPPPRLQATLGLEPTIDGSDAMPLPERPPPSLAACRNGKAENCHDSPGRGAEPAWPA